MSASARCHTPDVPVRCLIVDDNVRFLQVARRTLAQQGLDVVAVARTSAEALAAVDETSPDVVLVDIALGAESGFELVEALVRRQPTLRDHVVLISTRDEEEFADLLVDSSAAGFVPKADLSRAAIEAVLS
jgi:DNA-binding NarL/FixJ family response regulator